jgi:ABC-type transport system involved in cytochrome c biogenesis permease subunit
MWRCWRARVRARKGLAKMNSKTKWGAVIAGLGTIATLVGSSIANGGPIPWGELLPQIVAVVGGIVMIFGARDAVGKIGK